MQPTHDMIDQHMAREKASFISMQRQTTPCHQVLCSSGLSQWTRNSQVWVRLTRACVWLHFQSSVLSLASRDSASSSCTLWYQSLVLNVEQTLRVFCVAERYQAQENLKFSAARELRSQKQCQLVLSARLCEYDLQSEGWSGYCSREPVKHDISTRFGLLVEGRVAADCNWTCEFQATSVGCVRQSLQPRHS